MKEIITIELDQFDIVNILVYHLQDIGKLKNNILTDDIHIRLENGQIKCTIIDK